VTIKVAAGLCPFEHLLKTMIKIFGGSTEVPAAKCWIQHHVCAKQTRD